MEQQQQWIQQQAQHQGWAGAGATVSASSQTYQHHHHQQQPQPTSIEEIRTLWIGDLQYWVDETYLSSCFSHTGEVISIKIIRNKITGQPEGYGFIEFTSHAAAERILQTYNGTQMPGTEQTFRLNWASFGIGERRPDAGPEHSIFVGDLAPDVTDYLLQETFRAQYPSVRGAKVVTDPTTGRSKGYGFVKFSDEMERNRAMTEMNGVYCSTRPMRISAATPKKTTGFQQQYPAAKAVYPVPLPTYSTPPLMPVPVDNDVTNTTDQTGVWGQQADPNPWSSAYYGYGQGYDAYAYGATHDPSLYAYGSYAAYGQYPHQARDTILVDGMQDMTTMSGPVPTMEQREEPFDPLAIPDVDKLNSAYLSVHGSTMVGRPLWLKHATQSQPA
ncbi:Polyadenylate-binding protein RBP47B' [Acorus calamus]|uniref:Polyadenylate-binding protein RBP47B n=1 Tax=Acorus calamus TaxID=4465 RepID=A0AAV9EIF8_ACOCL|nr:Polyadenylate-binding protein RBP47B' [Acorus calamus]